MLNKKLRKSLVKLLAVLVILPLGAGCSLAPKFITPEIKLPEKYKEQKDVSEVKRDGILWKNADSIDQKSQDKWWLVFGDETLHKLITKALENNLDLKIAMLRLEQSRNITKSAKSSFFPEINLGGNAARAKASSSSSAAFGSSQTNNLKPYNIYSVDTSFSYEIDLFGKIQDGYQAAKFDEKANTELYKNTMLFLSSDVAKHYFKIKTLDAEKKLLNDTVKIRQEADRIMTNKFNVGLSSKQDNLRTKSQLKEAEADLVAVNIARAKEEHALAVLLGENPSDFNFAEAPLEDYATPYIPADLPSNLLMRRFDIASNISQMKAANSRIGVAKGAFFPIINLGGAIGLSNSSIKNLGSVASQNWNIGQVAANAITVPIFKGGENMANLDNAKSLYEEAIANYRKTVLVALAEVEDSLTDQNLLEKQALSQEEAVNAAQETSLIAEKRYQGGATDYFEVVEANRSALLLERQLVQTSGARFIATINLIKALGGAW